MRNEAWEKLKSTLKNNEPGVDLDLLELAYDFAQKAHRGQKRMTGGDYLGHPLATAQILAELKLSLPIIIAGLLHDVPEETQYTLKDIQHEFGKDIASMVEGITKLGKLKYRGIERYLENLRKMFVSMAKDLRVILVKFADRLHNLKTLDALPRNKQFRIALETMEIYAPIANRLGMGEIKGQLEDLAFKYLAPEEYEWLENLVSGQYHQKEKNLKKIQKITAKELEDNKIEYLSAHGRAKHLYSLYRKLIKHNRDFSKIHDLIALRVIVKNVADCYAALGIIHKKWPPLKGRIKDYIAQPKANGYQSLHTTVFAEEGEIIEFQIRTQEMHEEAEYGIAAHWHYDEKGSKRPNQELKWVQELTKWKREVEINKRYLEELKIDVLQNRILIFTPKGDVIDLPEDSTPVDFAYQVHTDIGNKCIGALINEQMMPLNTKLKSGDMVEIIVDKNRKQPSVDWLNFVKTRQAREKIKNKIKEKDSFLSWFSK